MNRHGDMTRQDTTRIIDQMLKEFDIPTSRQHIATGDTMQEIFRK